MRQLKITNKITSRESMALEKYLNDIGKIPLVSIDEEASLARRIRMGDDVALEKLTEANLRFVVSVAKQYQNQGLTLSDLINEGNVGLMKAARRFDETKGFKFISYAVWWIRQSILQSIVEHSRLVRMPLNKMASYNKVNEAYIGFVQEFERDPTNEELGELLDMTGKEVENMLRSSNRHVSVDANIGGEDSDATMLDLMTVEGEVMPDHVLIDESMREEVQQGLSILNEREKEVISAYYGLNQANAWTLEEIGEAFGLTRERVRQIKERAIRRLRKSYNTEEMKSYL